jgi:magnesium-transporting ATPase (P-type)
MLSFPEEAICLNLFKNEFIEISTKLSAVVACRCSPTQKADVARLIRSHTRKRVCCIGDGGNNISMIQATDVGSSLSPFTMIANNSISSTQVSGSSAKKKENKPPWQLISQSLSSVS